MNWIECLNRFILFPLFIFFLFFFLPHRRLSLYTTSFEDLGTHINLTFVGSHNQAQSFFRASRTLIDYYNHLLSRYLSDSPIYQFNHRSSPDFTLTSELFPFIEEALSAYEHTDGYFDITILPAVLLFEKAQQTNTYPSLESLKKCQSLVSSSFIQTSSIPNSSSFTLSAPLGVQIDLGGIAKGWILLELKKIALQYNSQGGLFDIGGDILCFGKKTPSQDWKVGIENPQSIHPSDSATHPLRSIVTLKNLSIATSGNYRRFYKINNTTFSHIINPLTCEPVDHAVQVTVIHPHPTWADIYATFFSILPQNEALKLANKLNLNVFWLYNVGDGQFEESYSQSWIQNFS